MYPICIKVGLFTKYSHFRAKKARRLLRRALSLFHIPEAVVLWPELALEGVEPSGYVLGGLVEALLHLLEHEARAGQHVYVALRALPALESSCRFRRTSSSSAPTLS